MTFIQKISKSKEEVENVTLIITAPYDPSILSSSDKKDEKNDPRYSEVESERKGH